MFDAVVAGESYEVWGTVLMAQTLMMLYHHPKNGRTRPGQVGSTMLKHPDTEIDIATGFTLTFPKIPAISYCTSSSARRISSFGADQVSGTVNFVSLTDRQRGTRIVGSEGYVTSFN